MARQYSAQFWRLLRAGWKLWPFVGVITYTYVPTAHRVLFVDLVEIAYSATAPRSGTRIVFSTSAREDTHSAALDRIPLCSLYSYPSSSRGAPNARHEAALPP